MRYGRSVENQRGRIEGRRELTETEVRLVNAVKSTERVVAELWRDVRLNAPDADARWLGVARTHLQEGFSSWVRAITRPDDPFERPGSSR